jgi:DUF1680 family protein
MERKPFSSPPCNAVRFTGEFWRSRVETNGKDTLPHLYRMFREGGRFSLQTGEDTPGGEYKMYWETEIARFIEAASYSLSCRYDEELDELADKAIGMITSVQQPDGYLNAFITFLKPEKRWKYLFICHELYNAGALMEAAAAHYRATGKRTLLDPVCRYAEYIDSAFGPEPHKLKGYGGHPGVEMGLAALYRATGNGKYLSLARHFVEQRGRQPNWFDSEESGDTAVYWVESLRRFYRESNKDFHEYNQSHLPVREQKEAVGHAVRALFLYAGMADIAMEYGDDGLQSACEALWDDICRKKMYVTGGVGSEYDIEGFGPDYSLPNKSAYAETCAAAGLVFFSQRMLLMTGDGRYADAIERVLYNLLPASVSLDGKAFFYENPQQSDGADARREIYTCACCPPNAARLLAGLGSYCYMLGGDSVYVNQYGACEARFEVRGMALTLEQATEYPWNGRVSIRIMPARPAEFTLCLRLPAWCRGYDLTLNGRCVTTVELPADGYLKLRRQWREGDAVTLDMAMPVERVYAHPSVADDVGKIALLRGPVVYCLEEADNPGGLDALAIPEAAPFRVEYREDLLGGVCVIEGSAVRLRPDGWKDMLYNFTPPAMDPCRFTAVPYAVWGNRGNGVMRIWMNSK